jgi:predicted metalloprotease
VRSGYRYGDAFVDLVVTHEWGHAVQNRLDVRVRSIDGALQADCLAGAELAGAAPDGTVVFESGDVDELRTALVRAVDKTSWTKEGDHGSASERVDAFAMGQQRVVEGCLPQEVSTAGASAQGR